MPKSRRQFLCVALGVAALPGTASAMRTEEMDEPRRALLGAACETRAAHRRVVADLMRRIEDTGVAADEARLRVAAMDCPFCGCSLAAFDPPPEGDGPDF